MILDIEVLHILRIEKSSVVFQLCVENNFTFGTLKWCYVYILNILGVISELRGNQNISVEILERVNWISIRHDRNGWVRKERVLTPLVNDKGVLIYLHFEVVVFQNIIIESDCGISDDGVSATNCIHGSSVHGDTEISVVGNDFSVVIRVSTILVSINPVKQLVDSIKTIESISVDSVCSNIIKSTEHSSPNLVIVIEYVVVSIPGIVAINDGTVEHDGVDLAESFPGEPEIRFVFHLVENR